jgi:predicted transcriptional regulator
MQRCTLGAVRRTNIYLSDVEQAGLDAIAAARGSTRSDVIRAIVDRELHLEAVDDDALDAILADAAGGVAERARVLSRRDPDLDIE